VRVHTSIAMVCPEVIDATAVSSPAMALNRVVAGSKVMRVNRERSAWSFRLAVVSKSAAIVAWERRVNAPRRDKLVTLVGPPP
jgi:hypothetical protein